MAKAKAKGKGKSMKSMHEAMESKGGGGKKGCK